MTERCIVPCTLANIDENCWHKNLTTKEEKQYKADLQTKKKSVSENEEWVEIN